MHMLRGSYDSNANSQFVSEQVIMFLEEDQPISDKKKKKKKIFLSAKKNRLLLQSYKILERFLDK